MVHLPYSKVTQSQVFSTTSSRFFNISKNGCSTIALGSLCWFSARLTIKRVFQREHFVFQLVHISSGPVTGHHLKKPVSIIFASSLQLFIHFGKTPLSLLFFRLNSLSTLRLFSQERWSNPFIIFVAQQLDSLQIVGVSLALESLEPYTALQMQLHQC